MPDCPLHPTLIGPHQHQQPALTQLENNTQCIYYAFNVLTSIVQTRIR